jgi:hypothetical protein
MGDLGKVVSSHTKKYQEMTIVGDYPTREENETCFIGYSPRSTSCEFASAKPYVDLSKE